MWLNIFIFTLTEEKVPKLKKNVICFSVAGHHAPCAGSEVPVLICHRLSGETSLVSLTQKFLKFLHLPDTSFPFICSIWTIKIITSDTVNLNVMDISTYLNFFPDFIQTWQKDLVLWVRKSSFLCSILLSCQRTPCHQGKCKPVQTQTNSKTYQTVRNLCLEIKALQKCYLRSES